MAEDRDKGDAEAREADAAEEQPEPTRDGDEQEPDEGKSEEEQSEEEQSEEEQSEEEQSEEEQSEDDGKSESKDASKSKSKSKDRGGGKWWLILVAVLVAEFYVYGRNGDIEVCVGKEGVHDFSLIGQERTDQNRWKFPRCESRVNLGLRSQYDELVEDATKVACRGATLFRQRGEGPQCVASTDGWTKQVDAGYIWPWDSRYYRHLLWFLFE